MKNRFLCLVLVLTLGADHDCLSQHIMNNDLSKNHWEYRQVGTKEWRDAQIPGTIHTHLMSNGMIEDPFYRLNEKDVQWIDKVDWEYRTFFAVDHQTFSRSNIILRFEGLDTFADIFLNDKKLGSSDNMFRTWEFEVKPMLNTGKNELRVYFHSPIKKGLEKLQAHPYPLPASNDQSERGGLGDKKVSPYVRKAPYHFGWDWGPRLVTSGIWRPVNLIAWDKIHIQDIFIIQQKVNRQEAKLKARLEISSKIDQDVELFINVNDKQYHRIIVRLEAGNNLISEKFVIKQPQLWYPNGLGDQYLYSIEAIIKSNAEVLDKAATTVGLRTVELVQEPDEDGNGRSFYFKVNGMPVFAKGANYIPNDVFLPRVSPEKYEHIIKSAAEAHMNMLRVWGGGIYENELFYDLCDQYGLLVWQDFMFACSMYPAGDEFIENIRQEAIDNVKRLRNHASIVLWCGNNEILSAWAPGKEDWGWGWKQRYRKDEREEIWNAYELIFHQILPEVVKQHATGTDYWASSPMEADHAISHNESKSGDMHYWGVWHGKHSFSNFRRYIGRFMSEYGFQSFPMINSVERYTQAVDHDIESAVMMAHQRSGIGNLRIKSYMEDHYKVPEDFSDFLYVGQLLQAKGMRMAVDAHRTAMPYCMGSLYWQLNDCWPVASWSGIDYYGRWKAMHYAMKETMKPLTITSFIENDTIRLNLISDLYEKKKVNVHAQLIHFNGNRRWENSWEEKISYGNSKEITAVPISSVIQGLDTSEIVLHIQAKTGEEKVDEDYLYFTEPKNLSLPEGQYDMSISENEGAFKILINSKTLIKNLYLYLDEADAYKRFSTNYMDVMPGNPVEISYPKTMQLDEFKNRLKTKHLGGIR
ncbi:MAG: glycoside hydrolase family 2 protein [Bacteroidales bacterium]|nr:glycoside hydrolase family 2 protein [Bacteroidales bacterium]